MSLAPGSRELYKRAVTKFAAFSVQALNSTNYFPASSHSLLLFITHLHLSGYAPSTIQTYLAAVCFFNKLLGSHDFTSSFILNKAMVGIQREGKALTPRSPITLQLLHQLIIQVHKLALPLFQSLLVRSMFLIAFHAFLRVGEFTTRSPHQTQYVLQKADASFVLTDKESQSLGCQITLRNFKGNTNRQPVSIIIPPSPDKTFCPVHTLQHYLALRGDKPGPLFINTQGRSISRSIFTSLLNQCLSGLGITNPNIKPHSFRIGAATSACAQGIPDQDIQRLGRWKSDAYRRYIRIPQFTSPT